MTQATSMVYAELEPRLIARAWQEEGFKQQLLADPRAAIAAETGGRVRRGSTSGWWRRLRLFAILCCPAIPPSSPTRSST